MHSIAEPDIDVVYHLAAVLSGQSEAEFDIGMQVNVDATRTLLEACRRLPRPPRVVFASTVAVFGGELPATVSEDAVVRPQSSYGTEKAIGELLVSEYSRRGFIDGIACRVATVAIRPGKPNSALSSFVSGIVREPLAGIDDRVPGASRYASLDQFARNCHGQSAPRRPRARSGPRRPASAEPARALGDAPARCWTASRRLGGSEARARVRVEIDERVARVVCTWPGALDASRAIRLGFIADRNVDELVGEYISEQRG